jgi:hypothetical protein
MSIATFWQQNVAIFFMVVWNCPGKSCTTEPHRRAFGAEPKVLAPERNSSCRRQAYFHFGPEL